MKKENVHINYDTIYASLRSESAYSSDGFIILKRVKKACCCNTQDILEAAKLNETKKIDRCFSHTTIFDFGITSENIEKSAKQDGINIYIPQEQNLRGITSEG